MRYTKSSFLKTWTRPRSASGLSAARAAERPRARVHTGGPNYTSLRMHTKLQPPGGKRASSGEEGGQKRQNCNRREGSGLANTSKAIRGGGLPGVCVGLLCNRRACFGF